MTTRTWATFTIVCSHFPDGEDLIKLDLGDKLGDYIPTHVCPHPMLNAIVVLAYREKAERSKPFVRNVGHAGDDL